MTAPQRALPPARRSGLAGWLAGVAEAELAAIDRVLFRFGGWVAAADAWLARLGGERKDDQT